MNTKDSLADRLRDCLAKCTEQACGDGGCVMGHPGGMHTNGGCGHLKNIRDHKLRRNLQGLASVRYLSAKLLDELDAKDARIASIVALRDEAVAMALDYHTESVAQAKRIAELEANVLDVIVNAAERLSLLDRIEELEAAQKCVCCGGGLLNSDTCGGCDE